MRLYRESDPKPVDRRLAFVRNLRRAHYDLGVDARSALRVAAAFTEPAEAI